MTKRFIVPFSGFIEDPGAQNYQVRYRVVSEDRNRVSAWSPIYNVNPRFSIAQAPNLPIGEPPIQVGGTATHVTATWYPGEIKTNADYGYAFIDYLPFYDVWYRFFDGAGKGTWTYYGRVTENAVTILRPTLIDYATPPIDTFSIEVYRPTKGATRMNSQDFEQGWGEWDPGEYYFYWGTWPAGWVTGDYVMYKPIPPATANPNLVDGTNYYIGLSPNGTLPAGTFALYNTQADAIADTNRINIGYAAGQGMLYKYPIDQYYSILCSDYNVTLP